MVRVLPLPGAEPKAPAAHAEVKAVLSLGDRGAARGEGFFAELFHDATA